MHVPNKPHTMGNECHSAAFSLSGSIWEIEMREVKYCPPELGKPLHEGTHVKTGSLLISMC